MTKAATAILLVAASVGTLIALVIAAVSTFSVLVFLSAPLGGGMLALVLNAAALATPFIFGAAAVYAWRAMRGREPSPALKSLCLCILAAVAIAFYLRFDPLLKIDSCVDGGGAWRNGSCER